MSLRCSQIKYECRDMEGAAVDSRSLEDHGSRSYECAGPGVQEDVGVVAGSGTHERHYPARFTRPRPRMLRLERTDGLTGQGASVS
jgi:hypothetical protein